MVLVFVAAAFSQNSDAARAKGKTVVYLIGSVRATHKLH
jgi:hypothetical protein